MSYSNVRVSHSLSPPLCFASLSSPFSLKSGLLTDYRMAEQTLDKLLFMITELSLMKCIAVSAALLFCSWGVGCQSFFSWGVGDRAPYVLFNSTRDENYCGANRSTLKTQVPGFKMCAWACFIVWYFPQSLAQRTFLTILLLFIWFFRRKLISSAYQHSKEAPK